MKLKVLLLLITLSCLGCNSSRTTNYVSKKVKNYVCLANDVAQGKMKIYKMQIPETWCTYIGSHDIISHSPKTLLDLKENQYNNCLYVLTNKTDRFNSKDIEEAFKKHIINLNSVSLFKQIIKSEIHPIYGKYYIVTSNRIQNGERQIKLITLINYNNQDYLIVYYAFEKDIATYIDDVMQMINSFKIQS